MKEKFFGRKLTVIAILAGIALNSGCAKQDPVVETATVIPAHTGFQPEQLPTVISPEVEWRNFSPLEKIRRLELNEYPKFPNFDSQKELTSSIAQFYCRETKCKRTPEQIAENVFFVSPQEFLEQLKKELGVDLELEQESRKYLEITTEENQIFVNETFLKEVIEDIRRSKPQLVEALGRRDLSIVVKKSILLHAYSHLNVAQEELSFEPFSAKLPGESGPINFTKLDGFTFVGQRIDGKVVYLSGANEAVTDLVAQYIGRPVGVYLSLGRYADGADLLAAINNKAGISPEEFIRYATGELSVKDFLRKWGSLKNPPNPDQKAALLALATIGLRVQGYINQEEAKSGIENWLGIKLK